MALYRVTKVLEQRELHDYERQVAACEREVSLPKRAGVGAEPWEGPHRRIGRIAADHLRVLLDDLSRRENRAGHQFGRRRCKSMGDGLRQRGLRENGFAAFVGCEEGSGW